MRKNLVEAGFEVNKIPEADEFDKIIESLPDYDLNDDDWEDSHNDIDDNSQELTFEQMAVHKARLRAIVRYVV